MAIVLDVILGLIFVLVAIRGFGSGFLMEFFRSLGLFLSFTLTLHYYDRLALLIAKAKLFTNHWEYPFVYVVLFLATMVLAFLLREGALVLINLDLNHRLDRAIGSVFSVLKSFILYGMIVIALVMVNDQWLSGRMTKTYSYQIVRNVQIPVYNWLYRQLKKVLPDEPENAHLKSLFAKR